jgi:hypothetical protein
MPTLNQLRQKNAQRIAAGGKTGTGIGPQPPEAPLVAASSPQLDLPLGSGLPQRGTFPAELVLGGDINDSNRMYRGAGMRSTTFPNPPTQTNVKNTTIVRAAASSSPSAATLAILVNGAPTPVQDVLNLIAGIGITLTPDLIGGITIDGTTSSTNAFEITDNFPEAIGSSNISGTAPTVGIGQLGWTIFGTTGSQGGVTGGTFPNVGQFGWSNSSTASQAGWLTFAGSGGFSTAGYSQLGWALADTPASVLTYIFKVETGNPLSSSPNFSMAQTALYVGLTGPNTNVYASTPISRPDFFIGVRYDTSTTAPSINDSFFTLEVVSNPITALSTYARNNTQGTTMVTSIAPVQGTWHTLVISFPTAGSVTLTLDGTATLTTTVPTLTVTGTISGLAQNGAARLNWTVGAATPQSFWNAGTQLTVAGFNLASGLIALNGTQTLTASDENFVGFDLPGISTSGSGTATLTGFPAMIPLFMMGNDDTSSPTLNERMIVVDFFDLTWNPLS